MHVLDVLDHAFDGTTTQFHLFGLKSQAIAITAQHPHVASADSQAYGTAARLDARKARLSKTDTMLEHVMTRWHQRQMQGIAALPPIPLVRHWPVRTAPTPTTAIEARIAETMEQLRDLHKNGEIDWSDLSPIRGIRNGFPGRLIAEADAFMELCANAEGRTRGACWNRNFAKNKAVCHSAPGVIRTSRMSAV
jgi:hypothetical protein